jgi:7-cyano-7-deazaguanine synthase
MDSVTLAHLLKDEGCELHLLSVDYGQRHKKELDYARRCAERLEASFDIADIAGVGRLLSGSALTDTVDGPVSAGQESEVRPRVAEEIVGDRPLFRGQLPSLQFL